MNTGTKNSFASFFWAILIMLVSIVGTTPILGTPRNIIVTCVFFALLFAVNISAKPYKQHNDIVIYSLAYIILIFVYRVLGISDAAWGNYMNQIFFFVPILMMVLIPQKMNEKLLIFVLLVVIGVMAFNIAFNIRMLRLHPELSLSNIYFKEEDLGAMNVGGSYFHTFSLMFFDVCLLLFLNINKSIVKWVMLVMGIVSAYYILFYCLKATVVIYFFLSIFLLIAAKRLKNIKRTIPTILILGILVYGIIDFFKPELIQIVIQYSPDDRLTSRIITILDSENTMSNQGTIDGRTNLYLLSLETWLKNPINFLFGIGDHRDAHNAVLTGIGQHSDICDTLARYGILGGFILFKFFKDAIKYVISLFEEKIRPQIIVIIIVFIICALTKSVLHACVSSVVFMLLPMSATLMNKYNHNK